MNHRFTLSDTGNVSVDNVVKHVAHYSSVNFSASENVKITSKNNARKHNTRSCGDFF